MVEFVRSVLIAAPVERVFAFHERADVLSLLSPSFPPVKMVSRTGGIEGGAVVELRIGPVPWTASHTGFVRNRLFVDEQVYGPFAQWIHRHEFESVAGGMRLTDRIEYLLPGGPVTNFLFGWVMNLNLHFMFRHRHAVTKRFCEQVQAPR